MTVVILSFLYTVGTVILAVSYIPQIWAQLNDRGRSEGLSIFTALLWCYATNVGFLYALIVNGDIFFILSGAANATGCTLMLALAVFNKYLKGRFWGAAGKSPLEMMRAARARTPQPGT